ncbi:peptidase A4 family-domain-containing protein [Xylariaceae sp. FL0255]|nr:peptidase A4 family-domain-containing protein [Xylariaceae sp. FL0255]
MKYTAAAAAILMGSAALATPVNVLMDNAKAELQRRNQIRRGQKLLGGKVRESINGTATTVESDNWSGAALVTSGVTEVSGTFTIPKPSAPSGGSSNGEYCGAAWVGIDGYNDDDLIQTGVLWCVEGGSYLYEAWYEYLPASLVEYSGITVTNGESVTVTATKTGTNSGVTTLTAGGKEVTHTFSGESSPIPGDSAEWIVEDFESGDSLVPFANFGTVTFTGATAVVNGATQDAGPNSVNIILTSSSGSELTSTTISGTTVTVKYV